MQSMYILWPTCKLSGLALQWLLTRGFMWWLIDPHGATDSKMHYTWNHQMRRTYNFFDPFHCHLQFYWSLYHWEIRTTHLTRVAHGDSIMRCWCLWFWRCTVAVSALMLYTKQQMITRLLAWFDFDPIIHQPLYKVGWNYPTIRKLQQYALMGMWLRTHPGIKTVSKHCLPENPV